MQEEIEKMVIRLEEQIKTWHSQKGEKEKNWKSSMNEIATERRYFRWAC